MTEVELLIPESFFCKNPNSSELGKKIIASGTHLLDELGYEQFTFKKLAKEIASTEASIYRYFENKHKLLLYLTTLYWRWLAYVIDFKTHFMDDPEARLREIIRIITHENDEFKEVSQVDLKRLRNIVLAESDKTYLTKQVDEINKEGLFRSYKDLCYKIARNIEEINPDYPYSHAIVSTMMEAANQQVYFAKHLPSLTEIDNEKGNLDDQVSDFLTHTIFNLVTQARNGKF